MEQFSTVKVIPSGKVALIAHDAGGAEILSSWIRRNPRDHVAVLCGPAEAIFKRKILGILIVGLDEAIEQCDWILSGSGNSGWELKALLAAKKKGRYVVSFLDHWTAYDKRFIRDGLMAFPDEIWVGDEDALNLARLKIPNVNSRLAPNPFWLDAVEEYKKLEYTNCENSMLYVSSDFINSVHLINEQRAFMGYRILEQIIESLRELKLLQKITSLTIRKHPSESKDKYNTFRYSGLIIRNSCENNLVDSIANHEYVLGVNSMALVIGKLCGKRTINFLIDGHGDEAIPSRYIDRTVRLSIPEMYQS